MSEVRLMNVQEKRAVYTALGMKDGKFDKNSMAVAVLNMEKADGTEALEGNKTRIDSEREFWTKLATHRAAIAPIFPKAVTIINKVLPKEKQAGVLKVAAMWLTKKANGSMSCGTCDRAVGILMRKSGVSLKQIKGTVKKAMLNKAIATFSPRMKNYYKGNYAKFVSDLMPIAEYYAEPSQAKVVAIANAARKSENPGAYMSALTDLNPSVASRVSTVLLSQTISFR